MIARCPSLIRALRPCFFVGLILASSLALPLFTTMADGSEPGPLRITIAANGNVRVDGHVVSIKGLEKIVHAANSQSRPVSLESDGQVSYATFMQVLDILRDGRVGHDDLPSSAYREQVERYGHPKD